jgi:hypothetical protein
MATTFLLRSASLDDSDAVLVDTSLEGALGTHSGQSAESSVLRDGDLVLMKGAKKALLPLKKAKTITRQNCASIFERLRDIVENILYRVDSIQTRTEILQVFFTRVFSPGV